MPAMVNRPSCASICGSFRDIRNAGLRSVSSQNELDWPSKDPLKTSFRIPTQSNGKHKNP